MWPDLDDVELQDLLVLELAHLEGWRAVFLVVGVEKLCFADIGDGLGQFWHMHQLEFFAQVDFALVEILEVLFEGTVCVGHFAAFAC